MSGPVVHPFARCAACEAPWHTGHAAECPRRAVEVEYVSIPEQVIAWSAESVRALDDRLDGVEFDLSAGDEPEQGIEVAVRSLPIDGCPSRMYCDACKQETDEFAPIAGTLLCRRCVPEGVTCDGCGSECFDFSQGDGGRLCICCVSNRRREDIETLDGITAVCERHGFELEGEYDEATWLEQQLAERDSARLGCEIAYRREPTEAEGDAHEHGAPAHRVGECFVPMGGWTGRRCRHCSLWVWGGPTAHEACAQLARLRAAQGSTETEKPRPAAQGAASCSESAEAEAAPTGQLSRSAQATPADFGEGEVHEPQ